MSVPTDPCPALIPWQVLDRAAYSHGKTRAAVLTTIEACERGENAVLVVMSKARSKELRKRYPRLKRRMVMVVDDA